MALDREAVLHVARLARLNVPEEDLATLAEELSGILEYVQQLEGEEGSQEAPRETQLGRREDSPHPTEPSPLLQLSAGHKGHFVHVPKVVDSEG